MTSIEDIKRQSLWDWALHHYQKQGVSSLLLEGQDKFDLQINIILWCCWCADYFHELSDLELRRAIDGSSSWSKDVTQPLRNVRRALKNPHYNDDSERAKRIRQSVKDIELEAECVELELYERITGDETSNNGDKLALARRNLSAYIGYSGAARREGFSVSLLEEIATKIYADET